VSHVYPPPAVWSSTELAPLAAQMWCGMCGKYTEVTKDLRCAECGL
jgi:hypothetical protein